jgi:hypothetical protein
MKRTIVRPRLSGEDSTKIYLKDIRLKGGGLYSLVHRYHRRHDHHHYY